ncbi:MAG: hypothetical protein M5U28_50025 [Sandaracinaceae bacterium]|nr:hypothetical protein [Sandaracinaceae bacterium]
MTIRRKKRRPNAAKPWRGAVHEIAIHAILEGDEIWIHTHGLAERGLPELEIRRVPTWAKRPAARLLNALADYLVSPDKPVHVGEMIEVDGFGALQLVRAEPREPIADHYDHERWAVVSAPEACPCAYCQASAGGDLH